MTQPVTDLLPPATPFASALRRYRASRRMSQLELALSCNVSARHVSFLETGRAQPSREMVLTLAEGLNLPPGTQNALLQAAGFAAAFPASTLASDTLTPFRHILNEMMTRHAPNPALLCDRHWNLIDASPAAKTLLAPFMSTDGHGDGNGNAQINLIRMMVEHPLAEGFIENLPEVAAELHARIQLEALEAGADDQLNALLDVLDRTLARFPVPHAAPRRPVVPIILKAGDLRLSFLSVITQFGTSEDVTIRDLRLELLFPADDLTGSVMKDLAAGAG